MFTYIASGGLVLVRCGSVWQFAPLILRVVAFLPGERAWLRFKAEIGIVESVYVKKIKLIDLYTLIYIDTFNRAYNERDLIGNAEAVSLAITYLENQLRQASVGCVT